MRTHAPATRSVGLIRHPAAAEHADGAGATSHYDKLERPRRAAHRPRRYATREIVSLS